MHATTRSIFPDTIDRSEQKWSFANSSHFFPSIFPSFFFPSPPLPLFHPCSDRNATRDKPHKAERFDRGREFWQTGTSCVSFRGYLRPPDFANPAFVRRLGVYWPPNWRLSPQACSTRRKRRVHASSEPENRCRRLEG